MEELAVLDEAKIKEVCNGREITKTLIYRSCWFCFFLIFRKVLKLNKPPETYPESKFHKNSIGS